MDKIMWLRLIRKELAILDQLAAGMADDPNLTKEEVELAIARSKIIVTEFEVLSRQLAVTHAVPEISIPSPASEKIPVATALPEVVSVEEPSTLLITPVEEPSAINPSVGINSPVSGNTQTGDTLYMTPDVIYVPTFASRVQPEQNVLNMEDHKEYQPQFKAAPLQSLKEGLSLNDRFLFQRELFDNDKYRLDEVVSALDQLENINEAVDYLKANFKWNRSEASEKFVHLVKRRFS